MENNTTGESLFDLQLDEGLKQSLRGTAVWAGIAAVVSLVSSLISFAAYFIQQNKLRHVYREYEMNLPAENSGNLASAVISFLIGLVLFGLLYKFSSRTKAGVDAGDPGQIYAGLNGLSSYFKLIGVLLIIVLVLVVLAVPVALLSMGG